MVNSEKNMLTSLYANWNDMFYFFVVFFFTGDSLIILLFANQIKPSKKIFF